MRKRDIFKLAWLKIKGKHGMLRMIGIVLGMLMLVEALWFAFAINVHLQSQINDIPISNLFLMESNLEQNVDIRVPIGYERELYTGAQLTFEQKKSLPISDEVVWTEFIYAYDDNKNSNAELEFELGGKKQDIQSDFKIKFIKDADVKTLPDSIEAYMQSNFGHGGIYGEKLNGKGELYISERLLDSFGCTRDEVLGKSVSMSMVCGGEGFSRWYLFDDDTIFDNEHAKYYDKDAKAPVVQGEVNIFRDYRVAGVISREYYAINRLTASDCDIWLSEDSLTSDDGGSLMPKISVQNVLQDNGTSKPTIVLTYPSTDIVQYSRQVTGNGRFFPFFAGGLKYADINRGRSATNEIMLMSCSYVQCKDFNQAKKLAKKVKDYIVINSNAGAAHYYFGHCSDEFMELYHMSDTFNKVSIAFAVIGGVTLLAVIINYAKFMAFEQQKQADDVKTIENAEMTDKDRKTLAIMEAYGGFVIALIISFLIGLAVSAIVKVVITRLINAVALFSGVTIALWIYFPAFLLAAVVMLAAKIITNICIKNKTAKH